MRGHGEKFGRKKEEAIAALLSHRTIEEAAKAVEINPNTFCAGFKCPTFDPHI